MALQARWILDTDHDGAWNMAADSVLLAETIRTGVPVLRTYRWSEPTVSLGYFQSAGQRAEHAASQNCPLVRRHTGGGAIIHDHEITYCLTLPSQPGETGEAQHLYDTAHGAWQSLLADAGVTLKLNDVAAPDQPFLCFQRRAVGDGLVHGHKVLGSAQRRQQSALLQHGSLLLRQSGCAPELPGILELAAEDGGREKCETGLIDAATTWAKRVAEQLEWSLEPSEFSGNELDSINQLKDEKYSGQHWTFKR